MRRYFLDVRYGAIVIEDEVGSDFLDDDAAIAEAEATAVELLTETLKGGDRSRSGVITVFDGHDRIVANVEFGGRVLASRGSALDHGPDA